MQKEQMDKKKIAQAFWERMNTLIGSDEPYAWVVQKGINKGAFQASRERVTRPLSRTVKVWAEQIGCNYEWLMEGVGQPFGNAEPTQPVREKAAGVESSRKEYSLPTSTIYEPNAEILELAISTLYEALAATKKTMAPAAQTKMILNLYRLFSTSQQGDNIKNYVLELIRSLGATTEIEA